MEREEMTNDHFKGIINQIIKMLKEDVPKEKLLDIVKNNIFLNGYTIYEIQ